jgi:hypothetical protein
VFVKANVSRDAFASVSLRNVDRGQRVAHFGDLIAAVLRVAEAEPAVGIRSPSI